MITRCLENGVFSITANRIGTERRGGNTFKFTGKSQIVTPNGKIPSSTSINQTDVSIVEIDETIADDKRLNKFNDLFKDRRTELYNLK
jgi:predicted amidohydrolase